MDRKKIKPIIFWIVAMIICPLGVALSSKSGFGVSMIEAPVFVLYNYIGVARGVSWYSFGTSEYVLQGALLVILCIAIRRFKLRYLLSFVTAFLFGLVLDGWNALLGTQLYQTMPLRILACIAGMLVTALAVAFFFRTWMPQEVWELFVKELSERYAFNMTKVKWIYDCSSLGVGILLMLVFFGKFEWSMIGVGTLITTLINAPIIGFFGKMIDKVTSAEE